MALPFVTLPSPPHSRLLSARHFKPYVPSTKPLLSFSFTRGIDTILVVKQHFTSLTPQASSSAAPAGAAAETEEGADEVPDRRRVIAQNLPWNLTAEDVRALFEKHGTLLDVELSMHDKTRNRGLAFITMGSEEEASAVLKNLDSYDLDGQRLKMAYSRSSKKKRLAGEEVPTPKYTVYAGNLAWRVTSKDLQELFNGTGKALSARIIYQTKPRRPAGYGFVSFSTKEEAEVAISALNGKEFMGRPLRLGLSKIDEDSEGMRSEVKESGEASDDMNMNGEESN